MEIWQSLSNLSPGVAVGVLCLYFYNAFVVRVLDERKEWNAAMIRLLDRADAHIEASIDVREKASAQDHALRGKIQEFMMMVQTQYVTMQNQLVAVDTRLKEIEIRLRGGGND